jgi:hypothetical protein
MTETQSHRPAGRGANVGRSIRLRLAGALIALAAGAAAVVIAILLVRSALS